MQARENQVACERRLDSDPGRLAVSHLSDHQDIRVLPQNAPQRPGEGHTRLRVHGDLRHAFELVFDRVLDGDDLLGGALPKTERRIQRGRLAAARRTCGEHDPVGSLREPSECLQRVRPHPQLVEPHRPPAPVEQPQHH